MKTFRTRIHPAELVIMSGVLIAALLIAAVGCQNLKAIPLFNPDARIKNRIGSAYEVDRELNAQLADFVMKKWMTQDDVDKHWSPSLDNARALIDGADEARKLGDVSGADAKL